MPRIPYHGLFLGTPNEVLNQSEPGRVGVCGGWAVLIAEVKLRLVCLAKLCFHILLEAPGDTSS